MKPVLSTVALLVLIGAGLSAPAQARESRTCIERAPSHVVAGHHDRYGHWVPRHTVTGRCLEYRVHAR